MELGDLSLPFENSSSVWVEQFVLIWPIERQRATPGNLNHWATKYQTRKNSSRYLTFSLSASEQQQQQQSPVETRTQNKPEHDAGAKLSRRIPSQQTGLSSTDAGPSDALESDARPTLGRLASSSRGPKLRKRSSADSSARFAIAASSSRCVLC